MLEKKQLNEEKVLDEVSGGKGGQQWYARVKDLDTDGYSQWLGPFDSKQEAINYIEGYLHLLLPNRYEIETSNTRNS